MAGRSSLLDAIMLAPLNAVMIPIHSNKRRGSCRKATLSSAVKTDAGIAQAAGGACGNRLLSVAEKEMVGRYSKDPENDE